MRSHRFLMGLLSVFFTFCILGVAALTAFNLVFGSRETLKDSMEEGRIYDTVATEIVEVATKHAEQNEPQDSQPSNAVAQDIAQKIITGERIQGYAEQLVDSAYNWLEGKTETPDFNADLALIKQDLGNSVAEAGIQHAQGLPVCTPEQFQQIDVNNLDLFSLQCLPPGVNLEIEKQKLIDKTVEGQEMPKDTTINADDTATESGEKPFEKVTYLPTVFQWSRILPWVFSVLALATGAGIVFLHAVRRQGLKKIFKTLLITGAALVFVAGLMSLLFGKIRPNPEVIDVIEVRDSMLIVIASLGSALNRVIVIFGSAYALAGGSGLIGLHLLKSKSAPREGTPSKGSTTSTLKSNK